MAGFNVKALEATGLFGTAIHQHRLSIRTPQGEDVGPASAQGTCRGSPPSMEYMKVISVRPARQNELPVAESRPSLVPSGVTGFGIQPSSCTWKRMPFPGSLPEISTLLPS
jgi:hypothetical protein